MSEHELRGMARFAHQHPRAMIALLVVATFAACLWLLSQTAPRVLYEFF